MRKLNKRSTYLACLIILSISINIYFRLNTYFLTIVDDFAKQKVHSELKDELNKNFTSLNKFIPETDQKDLFYDLFRSALKERKSEINDSIAKRSREWKQYWQDDSGKTYLLEVDPYRWYRRIESFLSRGSFGNRRTNNEEYDQLMSAPLGSKIEPLRVHYYIGIFFYKALHFINNKLSLMHCLSFVPIILTPLIVLAVFLVSRLLGASDLGSFISSLYVGLSSCILARSGYGWFDTDIYNVVIPLFIMSSLAFSFRFRGLKHYIFILLAGLLVGVYSGIWSIWWLPFYIILGTLMLYNIEIILYDTEAQLVRKIKQRVLSTLVFIIASYVSVVLISGIAALKKSFTEPFFYMFLRQNLTVDNFWPNLATSVSELQKTEFEDFLKYIGGYFVLFAGLIGFVFIIISRRKIDDFKEKKYLILTLVLWLLTAFILTSFGKRFILFFALPIGLSFGLLWDLLKNSVSNKQNKLFLKVNNKIKGFFLGLAFASFVIIPIKNAYEVKLMPHMNDVWWNMLIKIKKDTPQDAIINTLWDSGDWIMTVANRATVNDPSFQYTPVPYWISRVLLATDEKEAMGILRMLDAGSDQAFEELSKLFNGDNLIALELLNKMILVDKEAGFSILSQYTKNRSIIDTILKLMYEPSSSGYLLIDEAMLKKIPALCKSGNWDFRKLDLWNKFPELNKDGFINYAAKRFGYTKEYSAILYESIRLTDKDSIADWISIGDYNMYTPYLEKETIEASKVVLFDEGLMIDIEKLNSYYWDQYLKKWIVPGRLIFINKDGTQRKVNAQGNQDYTVLFVSQNNKNKAVLLSTSLADSLLVKLYFMEGKGLKFFKLAHHEENDELKANLYLYKINWALENRSDKND